MTTTTATATQVYQLFIRATPEQVWDAITNGDLTTQYFYASRVEMGDGRRRAYGPNGELWGDSAILEEDPPRKLVHEWQGLYDPELADEETSRVTWEIEPQDGGVTKLTLVHDRLEGAPKTAASVAGGWMFVLSGLKTLLETGRPLAG
ncbi:MAG TPA: SRPBCC family protein [Gaiella sp.]|nr:SRPBCC family protein [Gaiella sp.]